MAASNKANIWDWIFRVLSVLAIPLLVWGVRLEVNLAVANNKIETLQANMEKKAAVSEVVSLQGDVGKLASVADLDNLKDKVEGLEKLQGSVNDNNVMLGRLEEKLNGANKSLETIMGLLPPR